MLFVSLKEKNLKNLSKQLKKIPKGVSGIEIRFDFFSKLPSLSELKNILQNIPLQTLFTVRSASQGGHFLGTEQERKRWIQTLFSLSPTFFDLEYDLSPSFVKSLAKKFPHVKIICSYHNFEKTPKNLVSLYEKISNFPCFATKIACFSHGICDTLRLLSFTSSMNQTKKTVIGISLGEEGKISRILGPIVKNPIDFASLEPGKETGPGQFSAKELLETFRYAELDETFSLYGLVGDPINKSISHLSHNKIFSLRKEKALYIKMKVSPKELSSFWPLACSLPFRGFSVTRPLKKLFFSYLDKISSEAQKIGSINTLILRNKKWIGENTDGKGAFFAIEEKLKKKGIPLQGKKVLIVGAGGVARALAFEALQKKCEVFLTSRSPKKGKKVARELGCTFLSLRDEKSFSDIDILIQATPSTNSFDLKKIKKPLAVLEVLALPKMTPFLKEAKRKKCILVYGYELFAYQAQGQFTLWNPSFDLIPQRVKNICRKYVQ